jgi:hypothetical protein
MNKNNQGKIVITKDGKRGRTFNTKGLINKKVPVYLEIERFKYSDKAILCEPNSLKIIGFID